MLALVYLAHCAAVVIGGAAIVWLISLAMRDTSIIDIYWGFGFTLVGATCLFVANNAAPLTDFQWLMGLMPILWGLRLTLYLAKRNLGHGEDGRYIAMRKRSGLPEMTWRIRAFFTVYLGQGILILLVSAPVWIAIAYGKQVGIGVLAIIGAAMWLAGVLFEAIGDAQLARFLKENADYDGPYETKPVLDTGLWAWTRHPNYFGNALLWWGIFIAACSAPFGWVGVFGPVIMTILLTRVSGRDLLERKLSKRPAYKAYVERTSGFIPRPPKRG